VTQKTPSKPKPTPTSTERLVEHYNSQVPAYNAAVSAMPEKKRPATGLQHEAHYVRAAGHEFVELTDCDGSIITRHDLILLIRRQNHRLKRHIKARSHELLFEKVREATEAEVEGMERVEQAPLLLKDGKYTVGHPYSHILDVLAEEFPEASTTVACLRWYVVHIRGNANDEGLSWSDLPQYRPRSSSQRG
jgi:hypothetical protein